MATTYATGDGRAVPFTADSDPTSGSFVQSVFKNDAARFFRVPSTSGALLDVTGRCAIVNGSSPAKQYIGDLGVVHPGYVLPGQDACGVCALVHKTALVEAEDLPSADDTEGQQGAADGEPGQAQAQHEAGRRAEAAASGVGDVPDGQREADGGARQADDKLSGSVAPGPLPVVSVLAD